MSLFAGRNISEAPQNPPMTFLLRTYIWPIIHLLTTDAARAPLHGAAELGEVALGTAELVAGAVGVHDLHLRRR